MKITLLTGRTFDYAAALGYDIKVVKSPRASKLILKIDNKERIPVLTIPRYCSSKRALEFVRSNQDWIDSCLSKIPQIRQFQNGEQLSLFGKTYTIKHMPKARAGVFFDGDSVCVSGGREFLHRRLRDFIKEQAQKKFHQASQRLAAKIDCRVNDVCIKDTKSRWGSCSNRNNINYNWRIALAPDYVIKYLIAHEVSHLRHPDHSEDFWNCVASFEPRYHKGRDWLKEHGKELYIYE